MVGGVGWGSDGVKFLQNKDPHPLPPYKIIAENLHDSSFGYTVGRFPLGQFHNLVIENKDFVLTISHIDLDNYQSFHQLLGLDRL